MDIASIKASIISQVATQQARLLALSHRIHDNPEAGFEEAKAAAWLAQYLREHSFAVAEGICEMPTAFRGSYGEGKPVIAILAEYDALPGMGHACGHNIIATAAVGAGVAARLAVDRYGGRVLVLGTPAEEGGGGKILLAERGAFSGVDAAMMVHGGAYDAATAQALALRRVDVEFFGKAAHAAANPEAGINALDAMLLAFNAINALRQQIKGSARMHGIITSGGQGANIIPDYTAANFIIRADDDTYLDELQKRFVACLTGAAEATGARVEYRWRAIRYSPMRNNLTMAQLFRQNMEALQRPTPMVEPRNTFGSTDMGNVSQLLPGIHGFVAVAPHHVPLHSVAFREAAVSQAGDRGVLDAAIAMAMTVADLLAAPDMMVKVQKEFRG